MSLNLISTKWVDTKSLHWIEAMTSGNDGALIFAVRSPFGECLNKSLQMVPEPLPSNRDARFLHTCRFAEFGHAASALKKYLDSL